MVTDRPSPDPPSGFRADRREILAGIAASAAVLAWPGPAVAGEAVALPPPSGTGGLTLMDAIARRRSTRGFASEDLDDQTTGDILHAAFGINRPESGGRTAPSWHGSAETDVYLARRDGVFLYDAKAHALLPVLAEDIRTEIGQQPFVAGAPIVLLYVADRTRMFEAPDEDHVRFAYVDTAIAAENVYLYAAAFGLGTVLVGSINQKPLTERLGLPPGKLLTYGQPVGRPA